MIVLSSKFYAENLEINNYVQDYEDVYLSSRGRGNNRARSYMNYGNRYNGYRGNSSSEIKVMLPIELEIREEILRI